MTDKRMTVEEAVDIIEITQKELSWRMKRELKQMIGRDQSHTIYQDKLQTEIDKISEHFDTIKKFIHSQAQRISELENSNAWAVKQLNIIADMLDESKPDPKWVAGKIRKYTEGLEKAGEE